MDEKSITTQEFEYGETVVPSQPAKFEQLDQFVRIWVEEHGLINRERRLGVKKIIKKKQTNNKTKQKKNPTRKEETGTKKTT